MDDNCIKNDTHMKFVNLVNKFKNNYRMDKIVGMKKSEFIMLISIDAAVRNFGTATVSHISNEMRLSNAAISKTISELENQGFIHKKVNKEDKRQVYIELTEEGIHKLKETKKEMDDFFGAVFSKLGEEETNKLYEIFEKLYEITSEEINNRLKNKNSK